MKKVVCPHCSNDHIVKNGHRSRKQNYKCISCNKQFIIRKRIDPMDILNDRVENNMTYEKLAKKYKVSMGTIRNKLNEIKKNDKAYEQQVKEVAQKGNADAQALLGLIYLRQKDYTQAFDWLKKASEQGNAEAQYGLGQLYYTGKGTTQDKAKAIELYKKSAEQGVANAQAALGVMYQQGEVVKQDLSQAFNWYQKAAMQNNAEAQALLGMMYFEGEGVAKNTETAKQWLRKAADNGYANAQLMLGTIYMKEQGVEDLPNMLKWCEDFAQKKVKDKEAEFTCEVLKRARPKLEKAMK